MRYWVLFFSFLQLFANEDILSQIIETKNSIVQVEGEEIEFLTIWNFDNTILDGDTSEGRVDRYGKTVFKGLGQVAIEAGLSKKYPAKGGFAQFWQEYEKIEQADEPKAFAYMAQIFAGTKEAVLLNVATKYFQTTLQNYFYADAVDLIRSLQNEGIGIWIVTASPQLFVQGAGPILNIPLDRISGMESVIKEGEITDQMVLPLTTRMGKVEKIKEIISNKKIYVLAGFGNNNANDIDFLKWIAAQSLPAGKPLAVLGYKAYAPTLINFTSMPLTEPVSH